MNLPELYLRIILTASVSLLFVVLLFPIVQLLAKRRYILGGLSLILTVVACTGVLTYGSAPEITQIERGVAIGFPVMLIFVLLPVANDLEPAKVKVKRKPVVEDEDEEGSD